MHRIREEQGQTMAEYAVTLGVITLLVLSALSLLGAHISSEITRIAGYFNW